MSWSHAVLEEADGTCRVEITDEDGEVFPVVRQVTHVQADRLVQRIANEARDSGRPIKVVIRDPFFMAATVITTKRLPS
jgi:hypothetical protein